ncbi:MAG TPA: SDR family oxidoreductase [Solirubrobacteraceae bacterium]|jgi:NAD(P)-dependent dehydrogenase (short-subunit alcohol dehydrogenase family)|nr:SDR family oxidoreductase [Solirubrobacteraceae bacterium]
MAAEERALAGGLRRQPTGRQRTVVVTGSASGIGAATKRRLEADGNRVIGVDLHAAEVVADLGSTEGRNQMVDRVTALSGGVLDAVIACAAMDGPEPRGVSVTYFGAVATLEQLRSQLARGHAPRAVAVSSLASLHPVDAGIVQACLADDEDGAVAAAANKGVQIYASAKAALCRWVRRSAVAPAWAQAGIPLNAIAPGTVVTPATERLRNSPKGRAILDEMVPMPMGGWLQPEDIAELLAWLVSPVCVGMTGQVVFIDGGGDAVLRGDRIW